MNLQNIYRAKARRYCCTLIRILAPRDYKMQIEYFYSKNGMLAFRFYPVIDSAREMTFFK